MTQQRLQRSESVTLDASGAGQIDIAPTGGDWVILQQSIRVSSATDEPTAEILLNGTFIEGSYSGSSDASDTRIVLVQADTLTCVWSGGDPGATATYTVTGVQYPAGTAPLEA